MVNLFGELLRYRGKGQRRRGRKEGRQKQEDGESFVTIASAVEGGE